MTPEHHENKRRKQDTNFYKFVTHAGTIASAIIAIGAVVFWFIGTSFATKNHVDLVEDKFDKKAYEMESAYKEKISSIDKTLAIQGQQLEFIKEKTTSQEKKTDEILYYLRRGNNRNGN